MGESGPDRGHNQRTLFPEAAGITEAAQSPEIGEPMVAELKHTADAVMAQAPENNPVINRSNDRWVLRADRTQVSDGPNKGRLKTVLWLERFEDPVSLLILATLDNRVAELEMKASTADPDNPVKLAGASATNQRLAALQIQEAARDLGIPLPPAEVQLPD